MAVEVVGFEMTQDPVEFKPEANGLKENGSEPALSQPIKFGSHGDDAVKIEKDDSVSDVPKDVIEEWPAPKRIHNFYFIRCRTFDDPKLRAKYDLVDKDIQKKNQSRFRITESLKAKRAERADVIYQLKELSGEDRQYWSMMDEKRKEMAPLREALTELRTSRLCSSEEELDDLIHSLQYRIEHESIPLTEEKKLMREMKQLEQTREKVIENATKIARIQDSLGKKEAIQGQVKLMGGDLDGVRKNHQALKEKIRGLEKEREAIDEEIKILQQELQAVTENRDKAYDNLRQLKKQRDEVNADFYRNRTVMNSAKELASRRDVNGVEELSHVTVEKFMSMWNSNKAFRDDYERRILSSLDSRQLSRDGRMRNPDEKPLVAVEALAPPETVSVAKPSVKHVKEDSKIPPVHDPVSTKKTKEEPKKKQTVAAITVERDVTEEEEKISEPPKESSVENEVDKEKLKEMKRQEEIAKAKLALERKKKLAEKAAAKAAKRAEKEAEKKLKEREKKAKKKAATSAPNPNSEEEQTEEVPEGAEIQEETNEESLPVPSKNNEQKKNTVRLRNRSRAVDTIPKPVLKRKKSTNKYWIWAAPTALLVVILLVLGYQYLM